MRKDAPTQRTSFAGLHCPLDLQPKLEQLYPSIFEKIEHFAPELSKLPKT
jgi:hypothetical protein